MSQGDQGQAHKGPGGPTRAQGGTQEPREAHKCSAHKGPPGPGPQGPRGAHKGPARAWRSRLILVYIYMCIYMVLCHL